MEFARNLLAALRYPAADRLANSKLLVAAQHVAANNESALRRNDRGRRFDKLMSTPPRRYRAGLLLFQGLVRGYDAKCIVAEIAAVKTECRRLLRLIDRIVLDNDRQMAAAQKRTRRAWKTKLKKKATWIPRRSDEEFILTQNGLRLETMREDLLKYFSDPVARAHYVLSGRTWWGRPLGTAGLVDPDNYSFWAGAAEIRILRCSPEYLWFPFRFYQELPVSFYEDHVSGWRRKTLPKILKAVERQLSWKEIFDEMDEAASSLSAQGKIMDRRQQVVREVRDTWLRRRYTAASTLALAQIEGYLWDYAKYLNKNGKRIYKQDPYDTKKRHPYEWDWQKSDYKKRSPSSGHPEFSNTFLLSGHGMLKTTRLGTFFSTEVLTYLLSEWYVDRCTFAHGELPASPTYRVEAAMAVLCMAAVLAQIQCPPYELEG